MNQRFTPATAAKAAICPALFIAAAVGFEFGTVTATSVQFSWTGTGRWRWVQYLEEHRWGQLRELCRVVNDYIH